MNEYQEQMVYNEGFRLGFKNGYTAGKEDALTDMIPKDYHDRVCEAMAKRHQAEIANMVEVVRCKECKHWYGESEMYEDREYKKCHQLCGQYMNAEFWCKYGERQTDKPTHGYMWTCPICGLEVHSDFAKCPCCGYERQTEREGI